MLRLVCSSLQPLLIRKFHLMTFPKRCLLQNKTMSNSMFATTQWQSWCANHSCHWSDVQSYHAYKRPRTTILPFCCKVRLASTFYPENATGSVDQASQPTESSSTSNLHPVKLRSWDLAVEPFGSLSFKTSLSIRVMPLDPHDHPAADRAFVHLLLGSRSQDKDVKRKLESLGKDTDGNGLFERLVRCDVRYSDDVIHVNGYADVDVNDILILIAKEDVDYLWLVEVPMSYDVKAVTTDRASVTVEQLENQSCKVQTDKGDIVTKQLKSDTVSLRSASGNVNCIKTLQGNITIATGCQGNVTTGRLQGQGVSINAGSGAILVKDVYANKSSFESVGGDISLGNLHGDVTLTSNGGNLNIRSLDGSLAANVDKGDVTVYLAKHSDVDIDCKQGNVSVKMPCDSQTKLRLQASENIELQRELASNFTPETEYGEPDTTAKKGTLNGGQESSLTAVAHCGGITLSVQSWFDSLQLQK